MINIAPYIPSLTCALAAAMAFLAVHWIYFKTLRIAKDKKLVDNPDARKLQKEPIPVTGGIAVFFGIAAGLLTGVALTALPHLLVHEHIQMPIIRLFPVLCAMVLMLYVGAMDDILGLTPRSRLFIEVMAVAGLILGSGGCIDTFRGMWGIENISWWIAVPFTVFAGVGIINAVNMVDGVNGLSSGLCMTWCLVFGSLFFHAGDYDNAILVYSTAAALLPFFLHNVFGKRSRMFIGDAGTMVMGILMIWCTICTLRHDSPVTYFNTAAGINMIAGSLAILSVPVFDTVRVMTARMLKGQSPFMPDKTHLHHIFIRIGFSHSVTTWTEVTANILIVCIWMTSIKLGASLDAQLYIVLASSAILIWGIYFFLHYQAMHHTRLLHRLTRISIKSHMGRTIWWKRLSAILDAPEEGTEKYEEADYHLRHLNTRFTHIAPEDQQKFFRQTVWDFVRGRAEVYVEDILAHSGLEHDVAAAIVQDFLAEGKLTVIRTKDSQPEIVSPVEE